MRFKINQEKQATERANLYLEEARIEAQNKEDNDLKLDLCIAHAKERHWELWKLNCNSDFVKNEDGEIESCSVPHTQAQRLDEERQQYINNCFKRYQNE